MLGDGDMGVELPVELAIDIPDIVEPGVPDEDVVILMPLISEAVIDIMLLSMTVVSLSQQQDLMTNTAQMRYILVPETGMRE